MFHDGTPFRPRTPCSRSSGRWPKPSQRAFLLNGVKGARKVDAQTIEIVTAAPDAVLPEKLQFVAMMSRAWCEKHGVERAQDFNAKQETHTVRHANGTGPFRLERYEPDVRVVLKRHAGWWGVRSWPATSGNVDEVSFVSIRSDATRLAALASGEIDLVLDPPFQDVAAAGDRNAAHRDADHRHRHTVLRLRPGPAELEMAATSRAATRSRTCACAVPSRMRSTSI